MRHLMSPLDFSVEELDELLKKLLNMELTETKSSVKLKLYTAQ